MGLFVWIIRKDDMNEINIPNGMGSFSIFIRINIVIVAVPHWNQMSFTELAVLLTPGSVNKWFDHFHLQRLSYLCDVIQWNLQMKQCENNGKCGWNSAVTDDCST